MANTGSEELRIISLIASATEIVASLGFEHALVGRSHECDFPTNVLALPACSTARLDVQASSREIDRQVKSILGNALSVYEVFPDLLDALRPTHIITQTQCEVCAVSLKDVEAAVCNMVGSRPQIVSLQPMSLADVWTDIQRVADALEAPEQGKRLIAQLQGRLNHLKSTVSKLRETSFAQNESSPTIACIEWIDPLMAAGNWVPELVEWVGGTNLFGTPGEHSPWMTFDDLQAHDPDVVAVMPCGFDLERVRREMPTLAGQPGWEELRAVRSGRIYLTDGNQYFNRPGPRLVESAEILAHLLYPQHFPLPDGSGEVWRA